MTEISNQPTAASIPLAPKENVAPDFRQLDHQFFLDKQRMEIQHRNSLCLLVLDKAVFAIIVAIAGSMGYCLANMYLDSRRDENAKTAESVRRLEERKLEKFRTKEAGRRSLLEQQMAELFKINSAFSDVTRVYFAHAGERKQADEQQVRKDYEAALAKAREAINRGLFLFDLDFNKDVDRYYAVHQQMSQLPIEKWETNRKFISDLSNKFDDLCRSVIEGQRGDPVNRIHMPLSPITPQERAALSPEKCLKVYLTFWQNEQTQ